MRVCFSEIVKMCSILVYFELVLGNGDNFIRILNEGFLSALEYIKQTFENCRRWSLVLPKLQGLANSFNQQLFKTDSNKDLFLGINQTSYFKNY